MRLRRIVLAVCLLTAMGLAGCASPDEEDGLEREVVWEQRPEDTPAGEALNVTWRVTGAEGQIPHTAVHYAQHPVEDPQSPADYGNTSGAEEPAEVPAPFEAELTFDEPATYYVRAHADLGEGDRWSEEVEIEVHERQPPDGEGSSQ